MRAHLSILAVACSMVSSAASAQTLPLRRVRLYETGVAYFEREGALAATGASLPVPAGHLDDALKSLVVLSPDGSTSIRGVEFSSSVSPSMARALAGLPSEGGDDVLGLKKLLEGLRGAAVEVKTARGTTAGRVVEIVEAEHSDLQECVKVERAAVNGEKPAPCVPTRRPALLLLGKAGTIHRLPIGEVASVRPTDPAVASRLGSALDALSHRGAQARRDLRVLASAGKGVALGYIAETPVWRSTYRLVLGGGESGMLQGWALLHNDTDEDWKQVKVELVNGRPDSFLFPLAAPRYSRRELVTPESELSTVPQLLDTTVDAMWTGDAAGGLGLSGVGSGGGGHGYGIGLGAVGTVGHGAGSSGGGTGSSSLLSVGNLATVAEAEGVEAGAQFQYALRSAIDLRAHGSALVPFSSETVRARRVAWFERPGATAKSGVHLHNDGKQTLPSGPIAVFADGGFAGETAIDRLKPKEARVLRFGLDLDVDVLTGARKSSDETRLLGYENGRLIEHFVRKHETDYEVENRGGAARTVYLSLPFVQNAKVEGADEIGYDGESRKAFAVFSIPGRSKKTWHISAQEGLSRRTELAKLSSGRLREIARIPALPKAHQEIAEQAAEKLLEAEVRRGGIGKRSQELSEVQADIERLRANARAVGKVPGAEELVRRLVAAEDRAKKLRARIRALGVEVEERTRQAERALSRLRERS